MGIERHADPFGHNKSYHYIQRFIMFQGINDILLASLEINSIRVFFLKPCVVLDFLFTFMVTFCITLVVAEK